MEIDAFMADAPSDASQRPLLDGERVYFVPYRWWKEGQDGLAVEQDVGTSTTVVYTSSPCNSAGPMKIITNIFASDLVFNLKQRADIGDGNSCECSNRDYALLTEDMWLQTLKRKHEAKTSSLSGNMSVVEDSKLEVYPLQLRLSFMRDSNQLTARISKKDNLAEFYKRACKIFSVESEPVQIWDLSGQTASFLTNEKIKVPRDFQRQTDQEILLELQVYRISEPGKNKNEGKKEDQTVQRSRTGSSASNGSLASNGSTCKMEIDNTSANSFISIMGGSNGRPVSLGLTGLQNLGNTCFMNSAIQCLAHTPKLVEYFLGDYSREINQHNPLGMDGELAVAFGELFRKLWAPGKAPVSPQLFKSKLARFAPQFSGFNQHDSQELLAFLLDGLHEDLNRVKRKPYIEAKDIPGRPDDEVADEYWANHLARNDSIIVDVCQGQYRSTLVCPVCNKVSVTFDPFMYLSLPLPFTTTRTMMVTVFSTDGLSLPNSYTVSVPKFGKSSDLIQAASAACALRDDEKLLMAEIYNHRIIRYLEEPSDSLTLIRDDDRLVAYRISKDSEKHLTVVFMHQRIDRHYITGQVTSGWKSFGIPLMTWTPGVVNGSDIHSLFQSLMVSFLKSKEDPVHQVDDDDNDRCQNGTGSSETVNSVIDSNDPNKRSVDSPCFRFLLSDEKGISNDINLDMDSPVPVTNTSRRLHVLVCWPETLISQYDINYLSNLPEVYKAVLFTKRLPESVSLYACLEAFLREEPLGPDDMWYCPSCKMHRQASKKLDLWRLPEVLVIHLKRFSYSRFMKNKLETFVDFPIHDMDLSRYIAKKSEQAYCYKLYAVSNHYGGMGGGHYTAYIHHPGENHWYDFDDSHVSSISEEKVRTSAAYVLFYRRVTVNHPET